jgi:hypothetical protein
MEAITIEQMEKALTNINFFVGGLTDKAIVYYYNQLIKTKTKWKK